MTGEKLAQLDRYDLEILKAVKELDAISNGWENAVPAVTIDWEKVPKEIWESAAKLEGAATRYAYNNNWNGFCWAVKSWKEVFVNWANGIAKQSQQSQQSQQAKQAKQSQKTKEEPFSKFSKFSKEYIKNQKREYQKKPFETAPPKAPAYTQGSIFDSKTI